MTEFLVCPDKLRGLGNAFLMHGTAKTDVIEHYPALSACPIYSLPDERPEWLTETLLEGLRRHAEHTVGQPDPAWLNSTIEHLQNGDVYRWYKIVESTRDGSEKPLGEHGTWTPTEVGTYVSTPTGRMLVMETRTAVDPFEALLVVERATTESS